MLTNLVLFSILSSVLHFGSRLVWKAESVLSKLASGRFAIWLVGILGLGVAASLSLLSQFPQPRVSDEFSNLLAADTFAHGRLTNPTHPMWIHFESFHILQTPSYMSKFPPAQGMILALGQLLGNPALGVWLSTALVCSTVFWMLKQWVRPRWALLATITVSVHPLMLEWSHNFYGGQIAMAGGALLIGAFRRLMSEPRTGDGVLAGIGMAVLANSRPYEGLILTIALAAVGSFWLVIGKRLSLAGVFKRFMVPAAAVVLLTGLAMSFYNYRVTRNAGIMPYMAYESAYDPVPLFLWQKPRPVPTYNNPEFQALYVLSQLPFFERIHSVGGFGRLTLGKSTSYVDDFLLGFAPLLIVVLVPLGLKSGKLCRLVGLVLVVFCAGQLPEVWFGARYFAPAASLCILLGLLAMRQWRVWRRNNMRIGLLFMRALIVVTLLCFGNSYRLAIQDLRSGAGNWEYQRAKLIRNLAEDGGRHLVLVRYLAGYDLDTEWVYNEADIDKSDVIWARDLGEAENQELMNYFPDRRAWLLTVGHGQAWLTNGSGQARVESPGASPAPDVCLDRISRPTNKLD
jgi:hypothetical protein